MHFSYIFCLFTAAVNIIVVVLFFPLFGSSSFHTKQITLNYNKLYNGIKVSLSTENQTEKGPLCLSAHKGQSEKNRDSIYEYFHLDKKQ